MRRVDFIVAGSVAINQEGARVGKAWLTPFQVNKTAE
jgi:hypothetical protein